MSTYQTKSTGKVLFYPEAGDAYLHFHSYNYPVHKRLLEGSMWSRQESPVYGPIFRAATSLEALLWLRDNVGPLTISFDVMEWYKISTSIQKIGENFPSTQNLPLYDFQREAIGFLLRRKRAMLSLSPGLGKSIVSATAASLIHEVKRILVVAPASLLYMWKAELEKWGPNLPREPVTVVWHRQPAYENPDPNPNQAVWVISNPETVVRRLELFRLCKFDLAILDESILYKNRRAQRTAKVSELCKTIPAVWELTGAPANRMLDDLWSQFHLLKPQAYRSYWRFAQEYCVINTTAWGQQVAANKLGAEEKIKQRFKDIYFARSQEEVLDIPDWLFEDIDAPMRDDQEKAYDELATNLSTTLRDEDSSVTVTATNHLSLVTRLVQAASNLMLIDGPDSSGKWDILPELLEYYPAPYLIWTSYIKSAQALTSKLRELKLDAFYMLGETPPVERQNLVESYQAGKIDALVVGQAVGSFGLTLTAARTAIYLERNFDGSYFQSLHRVRRIGTTQRPVVLHLRSIYNNGKSSIDHLVHGLLDYRKNMIQNLTVGMLKGIL